MSPFELALVLCSALLHAGWSVAIKQSRDPLCFNLLQEIAPCAACLAVLPWIQLEEVPRAAWVLLALTGVAHGLYFYWMSRAYEFGELTLVYPIARSTPAFMPLVAVPLLGESISLGGSLGIATVVAGLWLVYADGFRVASLGSRAARYALLTLAATVAYSLIDKASMRELADATWSSPVPRAVWYSLALCAANSLVFVPLVLRRRSFADVRAAAKRDAWRATAATAVSFASYTLILKALETAPVSYVVATRQTSVLFALLLGVVWLREAPGRGRVSGAILTFAGVASISLWG